MVVALATDGSDGPTDAAGGIVDGGTMERAGALGLDPRAALARNNSYAFLEGVGDLLVTGPTNTNVNDLLMVFAFPAGGLTTPRVIEPFRGEPPPPRLGRLALAGGPGRLKQSVPMRSPFRPAARVLLALALAWGPGHGAGNADLGPGRGVGRLDALRPGRGPGQPAGPGALRPGADVRRPAGGPGRPGGGAQVARRGQELDHPRAGAPGRAGPHRHRRLPGRGAGRPGGRRRGPVPHHQRGRHLV